MNRSIVCRQPTATVRLVGRVSSDASSLPVVAAAARDASAGASSAPNWLDLSVQVRKVDTHGEWEETTLCPNLFQSKSF